MKPVEVAEVAVKRILISAATIGVLTANADATTNIGFSVAPPETQEAGEGGNGSGSVKIASLVSSTFLLVPDARQSLLVTVGEGGEGGEGGRGRRWRKRHHHYGHYYGHNHYRLGPSSYRPHRAGPYGYYDQRYYGRPRFYFYPY